MIQLITTIVLMFPTLISQAPALVPHVKNIPSDIDLDSIPVSTHCGFTVNDGLLAELALLVDKAKLTPNDATTIAMAYKEHQLGIGGVLHQGKDDGDRWTFHFDGCFPSGNGPSVIVLKSNGEVSYEGGERFKSVRDLYNHIQSQQKNISPCDKITTVLLSPGGDFRAELSISTCAWGFGLAAESAEVKVTKLGTEGYFFVVPVEWRLEDDEAGLPKPTIRWTAPRVLVIHAASTEVSGTLTRILSTPRMIRDEKERLGYRIERERVQVDREYVIEERTHAKESE